VDEVIKGGVFSDLRSDGNGGLAVLDDGTVRDADKAFREAVECLRVAYFETAKRTKAWTILANILSLYRESEDPKMTAIYTTARNRMLAQFKKIYDVMFSDERARDTAFRRFTNNLDTALSRKSELQEAEERHLRALLHHLVLTGAQQLEESARCPDDASKAGASCAALLLRRPRRTRSTLLPRSPPPRCWRRPCARLGR
jgi:hypothetical protein